MTVLPDVVPVYDLLADATFGGTLHFIAEIKDMGESQTTFSTVLEKSLSSVKNIKKTNTLPV